MAKILFFFVALMTLGLFYIPIGQAHAFGPGCGNENAQITVTLNDTQADVSAIKSRFDEKTKEVSQAAKEAGVEKLMVQSSNYNVNQQAYDKQYHLNGTVTYRVEPADKALTVMDALTKKGFTATVNVNAYNTGGINCNNMVVPPVVP